VARGPSSRRGESVNEVRAGGLGSALEGDPHQVVDVLAGVLDSLPVVVCLVEAREPFGLLYQNPLSQASMRPDIQPRLGRPWAELATGVEEAGVIDLFREVVRTGEPRHLSDWEFPPAASRAGGTPVSVWDWMVWPLPDDAGGPGCLIISAIEQTEHRRAEEQAQARELAERQRFDELAMVREVAKALSSTLDEEQAAAHVVQIAATIVTTPGGPPRRASLLRLDGERLTAIAEYDRGGVGLGGHEYSLEQHPVMARVLATGEPYVGPLDDLDVPEATRERVRRGGLRSCALAPVHVGNTLFGIITVAARDEEGFDEAQMLRLLAVAHISGLALGNAMRYTLARDHADRVAALERAKSDFLNLASHELRGPLTVVRGYVSMLSDGTLGELSGRAREVAPVVLERLDAMNRIIDQIIDTARLADFETASLRMHAFDLRDAVAAAVGEAATSRGARHTLAVEVPDAPVMVNGDRRRLSIALANLVDNALKFSPSGGEVRVVCSVDASRGEARVSVRDHGLGIAAEDMERIFTRFGRIVTPENSAISGAGLGLYLARETLRRHGGDITVESLPGSGSTFRATLPLLP
jgi:signal transduction histidine kinase